jgi:hypothetical protein
VGHERSPTSATTVVATTRATPRIACTASTTGRHRPGRQKLFDLALKAREPRFRVLDRVDVILEHDLLGGVVEADRGQPAVVASGSTSDTAVDPGVAQEKALQMLAGLAEHAPRRGARPHQIAHRLMGGIGHPHGHETSCVNHWR